MNPALIASIRQNIFEFAVRPGALQEAAEHHLTVPGKGKRIALTLAAAGSRASLEDCVATATAVELTHEASLIHDDLNDRADSRRGQPTVARKFGSDAALLLGDHFLAAAFRCAAENAMPAKRKACLIRLIANAVSQASSGQHQQLLLTPKSTNLRAQYQQAAVDKTGALLALSLQAGLSLRDATDRRLTAASAIAEPLGLAFQIANDLKPLRDRDTWRISADYRQRTITAPVVELLSHSRTSNPHEALAASADRRRLAESRCRFWIRRALAQAEPLRSELPDDLAGALGAFTSAIGGPVNNGAHQPAAPTKLTEAYR